MNVSYKIREWLQRAFTERADSISESYFFDRLAGEFYSVFITDYFLTDSDSSEDFPDSPYSKEELLILSERIERQETGDPTIVVVPRLTLEERKEMMQGFVDEQHLHDIELQNLVSAENGRTNLDFGGLLSVEMNEKWQAFKWDVVQDKVEGFCYLQNINLEKATLWNDEKMTTMTLDVNEKPKDPTKAAMQEVVLAIRPWWKFW